MSRLKPRPTNISDFSAASSANSPLWDPENQNRTG